MSLAHSRAIEHAATDEIVAAGGTVSHHHGVGRDHAPGPGAEKGPLGRRLLHALAREVDPAGLLNPGKLL